MTASLSTRLGLLTKATAKLSSMFQEYAEEHQQQIDIPQDEEERKKYIYGQKLQLIKMKKSFEMGEKNVDSALKS
ncbi:unnamed protein product [Heligmosomoides polygyrus]|uniref:ATP synthase-coupling factor 6, mitochondrial n=1 Tax=Heligmosomoides polygyrus TaxID=6339 RepID=A0A183GM69_HELPZ|nr:unnamed protein product [Heligmosomoides polygyrus]